LESDLDYSKKGLDDKIKPIVQGEELFQDCQVEHHDFDHVLHDIGRQLFMLEREKKVVQDQLGKMEHGKGVSFWPKPI